MHNWSGFLDLFLGRNERRPTRLGVFVDETRGTQDFWIEDGLPLTGITVETHGGRTDVGMVFGHPAKPQETQMTHLVTDARSMKVSLGLSNEDDSLEFADSEGRHTVLRFENFGAD